MTDREREWRPVSEWLASRGYTTAAARMKHIMKSGPAWAIEACQQDHDRNPENFIKLVPKLPKQKRERRFLTPNDLRAFAEARKQAARRMRHD